MCLDSTCKNPIGDHNRVDLPSLDKTNPPNPIPAARTVYPSPSPPRDILPPSALYVRLLPACFRLPHLSRSSWSFFLRWPGRGHEHTPLIGSKQDCPLPDSTGPNAEVHETRASPPPSTFSHDPDKKRACAFFH